MFRSTSLYLGIFSFFISFFSFLNLLYSYYFQFHLNLNSYIFTLTISLLLGIFFILIQKKIVTKISLYEKLFIIVFGFFYFPLLIATTYYLSIYNLSFLDCFFEAISGFTSTGFTIFNDVKSLDETLILWRSTSQWLGGLYFLFSLILLLESFDIKLKNFLTSFISINLFEIKKQFLKILILYISLTFFIFILLYFFEFRVLDSFNLSLSIISSGGFLPVNSLNEIIRTENQKLIISLSMLISFFSLYTLYNVMRLKKSVNLYQEDILLLCYLIFLVLVTYILFNGYFDYNSIFFSLVSSLSGIGFAPNKTYDELSIFFLFILIIGGGFFSTSSGFKFVKFLILIKYSFNVILISARPKHIIKTRFFFSNLEINYNEIAKYFLTFLFMLISFFILSSFLSFYGINFQKSLTLSILTLTNTVNSANYGLSTFNFYNLENIPKIMLIFFMILGRIEILSLLILFKKFFLRD